MSILQKVGPLDGGDGNMGELRYLRKCVRKEQGITKTSPTYSEYGITSERAKEIRHLAQTFVRKED
jgi:hypothetical protein